MIATRVRAYRASAFDMEFMRTLRNQVRTSMTGTQTFMGVEEQEKFWERLVNEPDVLKAWVYARSLETVGYGLIRLLDDGRWWVTLAVIPQEQGQGIGTQIYRHLAEQSPTGEAWAAVFHFNEASKRAAAKAGYEYVEESQDKKGVFLRWRRPR